MGTACLVVVVRLGGTIRGVRGVDGGVCDGVDLGVVCGVGRGGV